MSDALIGRGWAFVQAQGSGTRVRIQVVPNAGRTEVAGIHDDALRVRLAAPAIEGRANAELLRWLAESLQVPRRAVAIDRGEQARRKWVWVDASPSSVAAWLDRLLPPATPAAAGTRTEPLATGRARPGR